MFWNLGKQRLEATVARLVVLHRIDVLALAECTIDDSVFLRDVDRLGGEGYRGVATASTLRLYVRASLRELALVLEGHRYTIRQLELEDGVPILFAAAHLPSKAKWSPASIAQECVALSRAVRRAEREKGHRRSLLAGDLNLNPYEDGLIAAGALHAVPTRTLAAERSRRVQGVSYPMFYNPMWNFFGDETPGPPGTFFRRASEHVGEFWNMYDQVLVRLDLLSRFDTSQLRILVDDGAVPFHTPHGRPSISLASDHFPIVFGLNDETQESY